MMASAARGCALALLFFALLLGSCQAAGPAILSTEYKLKSGENAGMLWSIAEFEVKTDQEFFKLEVNDCPPVPDNFPYCADPATLDNTTCGPCNYASKTKCGTVERQNIWGNCTCPQAALYCNDPDWAWTEIQDLDNFAYSAGEVPAFNVTTFRFYIPEGQPWCNRSILFRMATHFGDPDIYVGDPKYGPTSISSADYQSLWPWISYRSMGDSVHVCPTDVSTLGSEAPYAWAPGTWWVTVLANTELIYNLTTKTFPIAPAKPPQDMSWCSDYQAPNNAINYTCLQSDVVYQFSRKDSVNTRTDIVPPELTGTQAAAFVARIDPGPCPRLFGLTLADADTTCDSLSISFNKPLPYPTLTNHSDVIFEQDYQRKRLVISFCFDETKPVDLYIVATGSNSPLRIFSTSNPDRFYLTRFPDIGPLAEQYAYARDELYLICPAAPPGPNGRPELYPCTSRQSGLQCQTQNFANMWNFPPVSEHIPYWPTPNYATLYSPQAAQLNQHPPRFADQLKYEPNYWGFGVILRVEFWNGFEQVVNQHFEPRYLNSCYVDFSHGSFVNSKFEAIQRPSLPYQTAKFVAPQCNYTLYKEVSDQINELIEEIAKAKDGLELVKLQDQLNYQTIREPYVSCLEKANSLVTVKTITTVVNASRDCVLPDLNTFTNSPCCRVLNDWAKVQCTLHPVNKTDYTYLPSEQALASSCLQPDCTGTFAADFASAKTEGCGDPIPTFEQWFNSHTRWWITCSDMIFGEKLTGKKCNVDADCVTPYNNGTSYYCEVRKPFNNGLNPYNEQAYTAGLCIEPYDALIDQFLRCFTQSDALLTAVARSQVNATSDADLVAKLKALLSDSDCVSSHNLGVADWDKTRQLTSQGTQRNTFANTGPCFNATVYGAEIPILGRIDEPPGAFYEAPLQAVRFDVPISCRGTEVAYVYPLGATSATQCNQSMTCNHLGSDCDHLTPTECDAACNNVTGACVFCSYGEHCIAPLNLTQTECTNTQTNNQGLCQHADGTYSLTDKATCEAMHTCTHPIWDNNLGAYRPATQGECASAGYCNDWQLDTIWGGACIFEPETYHRRTCRSRFSSKCPRGIPDTCNETNTWDPVCQTCISADIGCVIYPVSDSKATCESTTLTVSVTPTGVNIGPFTGVWASKARTQAQCAAHGCGCVKSGEAQGFLRSTFIASWPAQNDSFCTANGGTCKPYYTWTAARWLPSTWRGPMQWVTPKVYPTYTWVSSSLSWQNLAQFVSGIVDGLYVNLAVTQTQCRLNRVAPALEAISCACGVGAAQECLKTVTVDTPIGIASPCSGIDLDVIVPPHSMHFTRNSIQPAGTCVPLTIRAVPRSSFGNLSPGQPLSTYFTHLSRAARKNSFEFKNGKGAYVGQVIGDGLLIEGLTAPATNVTLCLDEGGFFLQSVLSTLNAGDYPVFDFASSSDDFDKVTPLVANVSVTAEGAFCGQVDLRAGIYVPIVRAANYRTKQPPRLDGGEQAIFIIAAVCYVAVIAYATYHVYYILKYPGMAAPWLTPPFWLCILLAISSLVRAIYFFLLGGQVIRSSNIGNMILVEVPTFIWFTATTLLVFLWISVTSTKKQKHVAVIFRRLFLIANGIIWGLLILFIILFVVLKDKKKTRNEFCQGRLGFTIDRTPRRVLFICYQVFLATLALLISGSFLFYGTRVYIARSQLRSSAPQNQKKGGSSRRDERNLLIVVVVCSLSFAAHAVLLLVLALVDPGIAYLVVILVLVEVGPSMFVLWANPSPKDRRVTATSLSRGSRSTTSKTSSATHSTHSSSFRESGPSGSGSGSHDTA